MATSNNSKTLMLTHIPTAWACQMASRLWLDREGSLSASTSGPEKTANDSICCSYANDARDVKGLLKAFSAAVTELSTVYEEGLLAGEDQDLRLLLCHDGACIDLSHVAIASRSDCISPKDSLSSGRGQRICFRRRLRLMKERVFLLLYIHAIINFKGRRTFVVMHHEYHKLFYC